MCGIWEWGLWNDHVHADRFMLGDDTCAYLFKVSSCSAQLCTPDYQIKLEWTSVLVGIPAKHVFLV